MIVAIPTFVRLVDNRPGEIMCDLCAWTSQRPGPVAWRSRPALLVRPRPSGAVDCRDRDSSLRNAGELHHERLDTPATRRYEAFHDATPHVTAESE